MLEALRGDKIGFSRIKRVVIVADSAGDPQTTFDSIRSQISGVGGYPVPARLSSVSDPAEGHPAIAIMLLPDDTLPGCLETLCVRALVTKYPGALPCVETFLRCDAIAAYQWPPEKLDKSRYHCIVAECNYDDPDRAVSWAFRSSNPIVDLTDSCFDGVTQRLKGPVSDMS
jgi:hypothetical protein